MVDRVRQGMRQCIHTNDAWRDGSAYRVSARRIGTSKLGQTARKSDTAADAEAEGKERDPDAAEPN